MSSYTLRLLFGVDEVGPWASLDCSAEGCEVHEAVRPAEAWCRDDELVGVLFDFAEGGGWTFGSGAWCPVHGSPVVGPVTSSDRLAQLAD
jgi:hypothetical protein